MLRILFLISVFLPAACAWQAGPTRPPILPGIPGNAGAMAALAQPRNFTAARVSSYARNGGNLDTITIPPGEEVVMAEVKGPGAITHIWTTFRGRGRDLILRFYWEDSDHPSIEAPIGDFFGVAMGLPRVINSCPVQVSAEGRARNCWWYMPFNRKARVTVSQARPARKSMRLYYYIDYRQFDRPLEDITYLHARFRETDPAPRGAPVTLVEVEGDGHFVGLVMGHRNRTMGWFGEGDDLIHVDGELAFVGTGTEDYFCDAWGFREFSHLYHGVPAFEGKEIGSKLSAYRFHIVDPIPFRKSFRFDIEHFPWVSHAPNTGRAYYSSLGFWYQRTIHKAWPRLTRCLSSEKWDPAKGRWHLEGALEAEDLEVVSFRSRAPVRKRPAPQPMDPNVGSRKMLRERLFFHGKPEVEHVMPNFSGDHMLGFDAGGAGEFTLAVPAREAGLHTVKVYYVRGENFGIVQLDVNGRKVGAPVDTYLARMELSRPLWPARASVFPDVELKAGRNDFRFKVDSRNPASPGFRMAVDCVVLLKQ